MRTALALCALALAADTALAQAPLSGWDTPRRSEVTETVDGVECVSDEIIVGLRTWNDYPRLLARVQLAGDAVLGAIPDLAAVRLQVNDTANGAMTKALDAYRSLAFARYAERNMIGRSTALPDDSPPNDPLYPMQWHLKNVGQTGGKVGADVHAPEGWEITRGSEKIVAAILDTGIVFDNPEFQGRLLPGWDFAEGDSDPTAQISFHGVRVAGVFGANANNGVEVCGLDQACTILPIKVLNVFGTVFAAADGIAYAVSQHADLMSMSWGFPAKPQLLVDALTFAADAGIPMIAATNDSELFGSADITWPGASPLVISVGFTDDTDNHDFQSSTGSTLDVVAPGRKILTVSATGDGAGKYFSGTSAAAPLVSAMVSLMKSINPHLSRSQVYSLVTQGAEDQVGTDGHDAPGWDPYYGYGRVNVRRSLELLCGCQGGEPLIASPQHASVAAGEVVALRVDAGREHAGQPYWIFGTASGPGTWHFGPLTLPLTLDDYTRFTASDANGAVLVNTHGLLDDAGQAMGFIMLPKGLPVPSPVILDHVAVVFDGRAAPAHAVFATNVTTTTVEP